MTIIKEISIFNDVVTNENSFTELFKNLLRFTPFREAFFKLLELPFDIEDCAFENFDTQYSLSQYGRPDLRFINSNTEILFEIKVYDTGLTDNQPTAYYNYLKTKSNNTKKALILIMPKHYYNHNTYNNLLAKVQSKRDNIYTTTIHWEDLSKVITDIELDQISPIFYEYSNFLNYWFDLTPINFDSLNITTMFDKKFPESLGKTLLMIEELYKIFKKNGYSGYMTREDTSVEYGFYINLAKDSTLFLGIWFDYWKKTGYPICLCLDSDDLEQVNTFETALERNGLSAPIIFKEYPTTYIKEQILMDIDNIQKLTDLLTNIISEIATTN